MLRRRHPALVLGEVAQAPAYARESLQTRRDLHDPHGAPSSVEFLAWTAAAQDHPRAARLLGAADRQWRGRRVPVRRAGAHRHDQYEAATRQALGDTAFDTEYRRGGELTLDEAAAYALGENQPCGVDATPGEAGTGTP